VSDAQAFRAYNYRQIDSGLATSGVVPPEEFANIAAAGFATVINLLPDDSQYAVADESQLVSNLGMRYVHIPVDFAAPQLDDFDAFRDAMAEAEGAPVWVHCAANWRVSAFVTLYGEMMRGWPAAQGEELIADLWEPDAVWQAFMRSVRERV
jgi:uncharacterized protein (TIGR01244 family)